LIWKAELQVVIKPGREWNGTESIGPVPVLNYVMYLLLHFYTLIIFVAFICSTALFDSYFTVIIAPTIIH